MNKEIKEIKENEIDKYLHDSIEDIKKCLSCDRSECNNCLKHKNFI